MVEGFFSKMTCQMYKRIHVDSKEELMKRILKCFEEINAVPVPYKWKYKMDTIDLEKEDISKIVYEVVNVKVADSDKKDKRAPEKKKCISI